MATKRMFSRSVVTTDAFMDLSATAKILYFYLNMAADDDGFVDNPRTIMRMCGASVEDWKQLVTNQYILLYEDGVVVIRHWLVHNTLGKDRYHETEYLEKKAMLYLTEKKEYTFDAAAGKPVEIKNRAWAELNAADHLKMTTAAMLPDETPGDPLDGSMNPPEDAEQPATDPEAEAAEPAAGPKKKKAPTKKEKEKEEKEEAITEVLSYLKDKTGHDIRPTTKSHRKYVGARLTDGYTPEELKLIIDYKCMKWTGLFLKDGTNMEKYLTPKTLFSDEHCNDYLIEAKEFYDTPSTPNTPAPAPAATPSTPSTPAVAPLPQPELDDDCIPPIF